MLKVLELFGGIASFSKGLERAGIPYEIVDYVDIDKNAVKAFNTIHGTNYEPQDICQWDKDIEVDMICHGSSCQDFSLAGKGAGGDKGSGTRSSLMWETVRIVEKLKPKYVCWENVKGLLTKKHKHNFDLYLKTLESLGYNNYYQVLNAKDYCVPQSRERVFTVSIRKDVDDGKFVFPAKTPLRKRLKDILEPKVDEKYYVSDDKVRDMKLSNQLATTLGIQKAGTLNMKGHDSLKRVYSPEGLSPTLTTMGGGNTEPKIIDDIYKNREPRVYDRTSPTLRAAQAGNLKVAEPLCVASRGRNPENPSDRTVGAPTEQTLEARGDGVTNTLTTVQEDNYVLEPEPVELGFRVRKLTPLECFRLMNRDDSEYYACEKAGISKTQLYHIAGNSIVVSCPTAIFSQLFAEKKWNQMTITERLKMVEPKID